MRKPSKGERIHCAIPPRYKVVKKGEFSYHKRHCGGGLDWKKTRLSYETDEYFDE